MTQYVDIQYIRNAIGITGTKESCKGCKYNEPEGFACNTYKAPSFAYVCEVLDDAPTVDAVSVIRCKECRFYQGKYCTAWDDGTVAVACETDADGYCYLAERKEEWK